MKVAWGMLALAAFWSPSLRAGACEVDAQCVCGQVCGPSGCVQADSGYPGSCLNAGATQCLYAGQTCSSFNNTCIPAWTSQSVCADGGTDSGVNSCTVDSDCPCEDVCATDQGSQCTPAFTGDLGSCMQAADCLYVGQVCDGGACFPAWSSHSACVRGTSSGGSSASGATGTGAGTGGGTSGGEEDGGTGVGSSGGSCSSAPGGTGALLVALAVLLFGRRPRER